jgi:hypothetical protein
MEIGSDSVRIENNIAAKAKKEANKHYSGITRILHSIVLRE